MSHFESPIDLAGPSASAHNKKSLHGTAPIGAAPQAFHVPPMRALVRAGSLDARLALARPRARAGPI